jgi:hypothetical protein
VSGDVEGGATRVPTGWQTVPEYFAKSVKFSVHRKECIDIAGKTASPGF